MTVKEWISANAGAVFNLGYERALSIKAPFSSTKLRVQLNPPPELDWRTEHTKVLWVIYNAGYTAAVIDRRLNYNDDDLKNMRELTRAAILSLVHNPRAVPKFRQAFAEIGTPNLSQTPDELLPALALALGTWPPQGGQHEQSPRPWTEIMGTDKTSEAAKQLHEQSQDEPPAGQNDNPTE